MSNSNTPNRFSGGCKVNPKSSTQRKGLDDLTYVKDIHWYPEKKTMVIEKSNRTNLVVDLSAIVGETSKTAYPIKVAVWNPNKIIPGKDIPGGYDWRILVKKDVEFTKAIQEVVDAISSDNCDVFKVNVTKVIKDVVPEIIPEIDIKTKHDVNILVFNPETKERDEENVVPVGTEITDAIESVVNNDPTVKQDIIVKVFNPESPEPEDKVVVNKDTRMTVALQNIANSDPTVKRDITAELYNPSTESIETTTIVKNNTEITNALQTIVEKLRSWDAWE